MVAPEGPDREITFHRTTPFAPLRSRGHLPHLYKESGTYFVTFRLIDAIVSRPHLMAAGTTSASEIVERSEPPLTLGSCALKDPGLAAIVESSLLHFDGDRYRLDAWCVMPNHVHVVVAPFGERLLSQVLHSWKSYSSKQIHQRRGTRGTFWESESFDRLIRGVEEWERFVAYVENNPVSAGLCERPEDWDFSSARRNRGVS